MTHSPYTRTGWMRLLSTGLLLCAAVLFLRAAWADSPLSDGEAVYFARCVSCHQADGSGIPMVFPPLDGTEWVQGDKGRLIRIVLDGMSGETEVQGIVYSGSMPPWKTFLTDEEVAQVLTYVRSNWSNDAPAVTTDEVARVRAATSERKQPWTDAELRLEENLGIPGASPSPFGSAPADSTDHP